MIVLVKDLDLRKLEADLTEGGFSWPDHRREVLSLFEEVAGLLDNGTVRVSYLIAAFECLGRSRKSDTASVTERRSEVLALAMALREQCRADMGPNNQETLRWFDNQIKTFENSEDAKYRAVADTAQREFWELVGL
jgi:hypothetical protein